ncbi:MAG: hypothetical protein J5602_14560 [Clostridia bacterium]|nr:hypothetical protein [Clostridia bacterium]
MKVSLGYAARTWGIYAVMMLLCLLFLAGSAGSVVMIILNIILLAGFLLVAFNEGAYNGERACTLEVTLEKQLKEGRAVDEKTKMQVFSRKTGVMMLIICLAPFLLISALNLAVAPLYPEVETAAEETEREPFTYDYDAVENAGETRVNVVNIAARMVYMPYVFSYSMVSSNTLNLLFLLYAFPVPLAAFAGYMSGPAMRQKKLKDIALGKKRKMRNLKVNRRKAPRGPKAEV